MFNYGPLIGATYESLKLRSPPLMTSSQPGSNSPAVSSGNSAATLFPSLFLPRADGLQHPYPMGIFPFARPFFPPVSLPSGFVFPGFPGFSDAKNSIFNTYEQLKTSASAAELTSKKPLGDKQNCPLCGEKIQSEKIEEHYRLELLDIEKLYNGMLETYLSPLRHTIPTSISGSAEVDYERTANRATPEATAHARFESFARIRANRRNRFQAKMYYFRHLRPASNASHLKHDDEDIDVGDGSEYSEGSPRDPSTSIESIPPLKKTKVDHSNQEDRCFTASPLEVSCVGCNGILCDPTISINCCHTLCGGCWNKGLAVGHCPQCCTKVTAESLRKLKFERD